MSQRQLTILYGSQSGTAQDLAEQIWRDSKLYHLGGSVSAMDDYDISRLIEERFVVFVCSTYGQGEEPDNMKRFWKFLLRKCLPTDSLRGMHFGVLGLGDSRYPKFNYVAKRLHKRLQQLGAGALLPAGLCDEQHDLGYGAVFMPWISDFWKKLMEVIPIPVGLRKLNESPREYRWNVEKTTEPLVVEERFDMYARTKVDNVFVSEVEDNRRTTTEDHFQDVRLITFPKRNGIWKPGDVVYVRPHNSPEDVSRLFELFLDHNLDWHKETVVLLKEIDSEMPVPAVLNRPLSFEILAQQYWDLSAIPRARAFAVLARTCTDELEREKLKELSSYEGQEELYAYANRPRRTILELLQDFPHACSALSLAALFELFQPIKPRAFSIASSAASGKLQILVAVIEYKTKLKQPRRGLCSNWLKRLQPGDSLRMWTRKGTFVLPTVTTVPIVMVGPGTGLAPFRAVLQERELLLEPRKNGPLVLFFGCRNAKADFHCEEDLRRMEGSGILTLFCAFSRDQEDKIYVQHILRTQTDLLRKLLLEQNGLFLVSGSSKNMPEAVREALGEAIGSSLYVEEMMKNDRYQEETWA
ncbi:NADPH-dependent diflavin oxidoreductase 1 [Topomyia yanbarensis]|uniref:NADPH-dependent diflavin oxidoreductase 1 n=1 Tax=Topomyia yanbarensis TaxID=2498891 RepID=UPI00273BB88C|nr:NADPH-dependent diflavin oxidoreductase 1 [Topomyia yanbarensis]XP_058813461.1 NADPH-dependent diflavin oxidoreductase 1 [Topomyia yanbarensis]